MISNKLAKELKDARVPFKYATQSEVTSDVQSLPTPNCVVIGNVLFKIPIELIEACGEYCGLEKHSNDWRAGTLKTGGINAMASGSTPTEAVARLWIALRREEPRGATSIAPSMCLCNPRIRDAWEAKQKSGDICGRAG
jgi:hypothetical protein